ncbi:MAG: Mur ligase family protein [Actinomycetia bacterium]|nr:Mur ligase family protein [Actinomycetes bacterium]
MSPVVARFADALARLKSTKRWDINPSLEGMRELCRLLGDPQSSYQTIQVAGTNGKTSVTRLTAALLRAAGLTTGMYTSPELIRYNERIEIGSTPLSDADFARALQEVFDCADTHDLQLTEFELTTAAALVAFRNAAVDVGVLEVGLGGRWDATSVAEPQVAVITGIGLDHQALLGDTLLKIAAEKAAIIKPSARAAVLGPLTAVTPEVERLIIDQARRCGVPVQLVRAPFDALEGLSYAGPAYQLPNIATALAAVELLLAQRESEAGSASPGCAPQPNKRPATASRNVRGEDSPGCAHPASLSRCAVQQVLDTIRFPGRFELINDDSPAYYDGAHNPQAAQVLAETLRQRGLRPTIALGVFADKDYRGIVEALAPLARAFIAIQPPGARALSAEELAVVITEQTGISPLATCAVWNLKKLLAVVEVTEDEPLLVTGSLSLYALLQS